MAIKVLNITNDARQRHTISTPARDVILVLYYFATVQSWFMDVEYGERSVKGVRLVVGASLLPSAGLPLDFRVQDTQNIGLDPYSVDDFVTDRCRLFMLSAEDMERLRGQPVPL